MPITKRPKTVRASSIVCTNGLATRASTIAAPVGRSVMESSKLILIMPLPLLSTRDRRQLPYQERSLSCNRDQTFYRRQLSGEKGRTIPRGFRIVLQDTQADREASNCLLPPESSEWLPRLLPRSRGRSPLFCGSPERECRTRFR